MIKLSLDIPPEVEDLFGGLSDREMETILLDAAEGYCGPGGVLERHWLAGQNSWGDPDDYYLDWKREKHGNDDKFVKTGDALKALTGKSPYRVIKASRQGSSHRVEVALVRIENGRNVYSIAQAGGRNLSGPPMRITDTLPGDAEIIKPHVEASVLRQLGKKGVI